LRGTLAKGMAGEHGKRRPGVGGWVWPCAAGPAGGAGLGAALGLVAQVSQVILAQLVVANCRVYDGLLRWPGQRAVVWSRSWRGPL